MKQNEENNNAKDGMGMWDLLVENLRSRAQSRSPSSLLCDSLGFALGWTGFLYDSSLSAGGLDLCVFSFIFRRLGISFYNKPTDVLSFTLIEPSLIPGSRGILFTD